MPRDFIFIFAEPCMKKIPHFMCVNGYFVIQNKHGLPYCVTCPGMSTDHESLNPVLANMLYLYYSTGSLKLFWYPHSGIQCQREAVWVAAESANLWSGALHTATTTTTTNTSAFNDTSRHIGDKNWIWQILLRVSSSIPINYTCYQHTAVGKYCTLCVQMMDGANWHEAPRKLGLLTFFINNNDNDNVYWHKSRSSTSWLNSILQCTVSLGLSQIWLCALYSTHYKCMGWNKAHTQLKLKQNMYNEKKKKEREKNTEMRKLERENARQSDCHDEDIGGLMQDCSNSSALAMESLQPHTEPSRQWLPQWLLFCKLLYH